MDERHRSGSAEETRALGVGFGQSLVPRTLVCFRGDLGAGKTTFIQGVLAACGANPPFVSPTFVLMKEYDLVVPTSNSIRRIYHADAYRIERVEHFENIGFAEWCADPEGVVLLEWPERIEALLPETRIEITLSLQSNEETSREVHISKKSH